MIDHLSAQNAVVAGALGGANWTARQISYGMDLPESFGLLGNGAKLDLRWISTRQTKDDTVILEGQNAVDCAGAAQQPPWWLETRAAAA